MAQLLRRMAQLLNLTDQLLILADQLLILKNSSLIPRREFLPLGFTLFFHFFHKRRFFMSYLPQADVPCLEWARNFVQYGSANATRWGLTADDFAPVGAAGQAYEAALQRCNLPETSKLDRAAKNAAKKTLRNMAREFVNQHLRYNPAVTDLDRIALGIPVQDKILTPGSKPATIPETEIRISRIRSVSLYIKDAGSTRRGKPKGVHGAEIRWDIRDTPPEKPEDLANSYFFTRSPAKFDFSEDERGKMVYFCPRWENRTGKKGDWGEIVAAIIP
jgi:hypothetical protein